MMNQTNTKSKKSNQKTNAVQSDKTGETTSTCQNNNVPQNQESFQIPEILKGKTFLDPTYDSSFKELFSDKKMLIHFLNGVLHLEGNNAFKVEYRILRIPLESIIQISAFRCSCYYKRRKNF